MLGIETCAVALTVSYGIARSAYRTFRCLRYHQIFVSNRMNNVFKSDENSGPTLTFLVHSTVL